MEELRRSGFYADYGERIESLLKTPQLRARPEAKPRLRSFLRIAQWNIEKGKHFDAILDRLREDDILKWADILILNEADCGMIRSHNRHVALDLADALGMHMAFAPAHVELTKGIDEERFLEGENQESLQGNAVLSRYPMTEARVVTLPATYEPYESGERRYGRRNCLWVRIRLDGSFIWVGSTHLELRNTPLCRALEMRHIMENLPGSAFEAHVLGGDWNTNTFRRGTSWRMFQSILRILCSPAERTRKRLLHPDEGPEPLFRVLRDRGFSWKEFNSHEETACAEMDSLEEKSLLPPPWAGWVQKRLQPFQGQLRLKLDWIAARGVQALSQGRKRDAATGVFSVNPACAKGLNAGPDRASDHLPIYADLDIEQVAVMSRAQGADGLRTSADRISAVPAKILPDGKTHWVIS